MIEAMEFKVGAAEVKACLCATMPRLLDNKCVEKDQALIRLYHSIVRLIGGETPVTVTAEAVPYKKLACIQEENHFNRRLYETIYKKEPCFILLRVCETQPMKLWKDRLQLIYRLRKISKIFVNNKKFTGRSLASS